MSTEVLSGAVTLVGTVLAAAILGLVTILRRRRARRSQLNRPVEINVSPMNGDKWSVVFAGEMPDAYEIEGGELTARDVYKWLRERGAVDFRETRLKLTVRGASDEIVVVRNIRVEVAHAAPLAGTYIHSPTAGANAATLLVFDLDEEMPTAREWREDGGRQQVGDKPYFDYKNVTIKQGEIHDFVVIGSASKSFARWRLLLDLEVGSHRRTVIVDDSGACFRTTGVPESGFATTLHWAWYDGRRFLPPPSYN